MGNFINQLKEKWNALKKRFAADEAFKKKVCIGAIVAVVLILVIVLLCLLPGKSSGTPDKEKDGPSAEQATGTDVAEVQPIVEPEGMKEIMAKYEDVYAWLEMPGTGAVEKSTGKPYHQQENAEGKVVAADLSLPVVHSPEEREYYLKHNIDKKEDSRGTLFTDDWVEGKFCNGTDMNDPVTVIYGHNQANREMLGGIMSYALDIDYAKDEPHLMYIYQEGRRLTYRIFAGLQYDKCHILYNFDGLRDQETFEYFFNTEMYQFANGIINVDENNKPVFGDKVVVLSVCKDGDIEHEFRNLIMGVLVEDTDVTAPADMTPAAQKWAKAAAKAGN